MKRITANEKRYLARVAQMNCVICNRWPVHLHHVKEGPDGQFIGMGVKSDPLDVLPLCPEHHQTGGMGVAYHAGPRTWVEKFGTQQQLLTALREWMNDPAAPYPKAEVRP